VSSIVSSGPSKIGDEHFVRIAVFTNKDWSAPLLFRQGSVSLNGGWNIWPGGLSLRARRFFNDRTGA
jgi:hypothetical protein